MSLSIAQLYRQDENKYKLDLLAGRQGLSHDVAWVQVMEDADYGTFLRPHAFIFTTGLASPGDPHWLENLVGRPGRQYGKVPLAVGYYGSLERTL